jgi:diaminohydroxyphosphoribosylaminopyrimidine deaminase / 5-amino-6-(5-phosphoribosylamino)uracil reductase
VLTDAAYMARALLLAGRAAGRTTPNPMVGAVVVSPDGVVLGSGYHVRAGEPHAEVHALDAAGGAARGATLYCTLEPCSHHGRTPPCVDRIVASGVARVVAAIQDPNPRVAGRGFRALAAEGVQVDVGTGADAARRLNAPFFSVMLRGRPFVIVKAATSLDGRVAAGAGRTTRLTSAAADRQTQVLRASVDAIAVGSGTMLADDPLLTVRDVYRERALARVIFDRRLRTPATARVFSTLALGPVYVLTTAEFALREAAKAQRLEAAGATVVPMLDGGIPAALATLAGLGIQSLLVEGGPALHDALRRAGAIDAVRLIVTPRVLGAAGVPWIASHQLPVPSLRHVDVVPCGPDVIIEGHVYRTD